MAPVQIIVTDNWSQLHGPFAAIDKLRKEMSWFDPKARFTKLFKIHKWDGLVSIIGKDNTFPTGLLDIVMTKLTGYGCNVTIAEDHRVIQSQGTPEKQFEWEWIGKDLANRGDTQIDAVSSMFTSYRGVIKLPTGVGKSTVFLKYLCDLGLKTIITVDRQDLLYQTMEGIVNSIKGAKVGLLGDGNRPGDDDEIVIAIYASLRSLQKGLGEYWDEWVSQFRVLICDECHKAGSDGVPTATWNVLMTFPAPYRFGFSATPFVKGSKGLKYHYLRGLFGEQLTDMTVADAVEKGFLVKSEVYFMKPKYDAALLATTSWHDKPKNNGGWYDLGEEDDGPERTYSDEHMRYIVENETRNDLIVAVTRQMLDEGHKILVVAQSIPHNDLLFDTLDQDTSVPVFQFHGSVKKRKDVMTAYKGTKGPCIMVASSIANDGIDVPDITCIVLAHGGKSFYQVIQRIGRGLRTAEGKDRLVVVDFDDSALGIWFSHHVKERKKLYKEEIGATIFDIQ